MRRLVHNDGGRKTLVEIPDGKPDSHARYGVVIGPPDLSALGLPSEIEIRLHNELFARGILTHRDAKKRRQEIVNALHSVFAVNAERILNIYSGVTD